MSQTAKDLDVPESNSTSSGAGKAQPVALEVAVTVNGARTVGNSDKREPFSETTQTVLVFGNGAVIRLASTVAPGQLLFLTNEKTKKEVVCQVLKSKNYSNVSGYVELEFTEPISGFWGIRFPETPVKSGAPAPTGPVAAKPAAPPAPASAPKPQTPVVSTTPKPALPVTPSAPRIEVKAPSTAAPPKAPAAPIATSSRTPEVKPPAPVVPTTSAPTAPVNAQTPSSSDALRRESARLQEQLSAMQFGSQAPAANKPASTDSIPKVIEMTRPQAPATRVVPPTKAPSNLEAEEVKVPSWLEPLARNAATPSHNEAVAEQEPVEAEQVIEYEVQDAEPAATHQISLVTPLEPALDVQPVGRGFGQEQTAGALEAGGNKMILIGAVAAGFLVLSIGGALLLRRSPSPAVQTTSASVAATGTAAVQPTSTNAASPVPNSANTSSSGGSSAPVVAPPAASPSLTPTAQPLKAASSKNTAAELSAYKKLAEPQPQPAVQQPSKKPGLGQVRLAAPAAVRRSNTSDAAPADLAPALGGGQIALVGGDSLGGGLAAGAAKQPVAPPKPLPVGGEVKQAKLVSSTPPAYPTLAKTQHIEGNVRVDALVDETGRVSAVKVVSGPTLLHQAAMDAIRQWKYEPATLDGKPVPMHLTVTLQFRLQ